jgi:hypothetical protein
MRYRVRPSRDLTRRSVALVKAPIGIAGPFPKNASHIVRIAATKFQYGGVLGLLEAVKRPTPKAE